MDDDLIYYYTLIIESDIRDRRERGEKLEGEEDEADD